MAASRVSVLIPSYRHEAYIGAAIESVLDQTLQPHEILVVDDGSTDGTAAVVQRYADRVTLHARPHSGIARTYNFGLRAAAAGDYVAVLESDDRWDPGYIAAVVDYLESNPDVAYLTTARRIMDGNGSLTERVTGKRTPGERYTTEGILLHDWVSVPTPVFRVDALERIGPYDETLEFGCDSEIALRASVRVPMAHLRRPLYLYRLHASNTSGDKMRSVREALGALDRFSAKHPRLPRVADRALHRRYANLYTRLGKHLRRSGEGTRGEVVSTFLRARAHAPYRLGGYVRLLQAYLTSR